MRCAETLREQLHRAHSPRRAGLGLAVCGVAAVDVSRPGSMPALHGILRRAANGDASELCQRLQAARISAANPDLHCRMNHPRATAIARAGGRPDAAARAALTSMGGSCGCSQPLLTPWRAAPLEPATAASAERAGWDAIITQPPLLLASQHGSTDTSGRDEERCGKRAR